MALYSGKGIFPILKALIGFGAISLTSCSQPTIIPVADHYGFQQVDSWGGNPPQYIVCGHDGSPCPSISSLQSEKVPIQSPGKADPHPKKKAKVCDCAQKGHLINPSSSSKQ